jgi:2,4-dienoyl-CoA reductase-like NADH-dependent reductase (Old Yellow Enzyme family)
VATSDAASKLFSQLVLPNGAHLSNRVAKAAMEENMADENHAPSAAILRLYRAWAGGGAGLIITGNVMIDRRAMTGPAGIVLENNHHIERFQRWAQTAHRNGARIWMQINHPGRQMAAALGQETWAPSAVALDVGRFSKGFGIPKEMTENDIAEVVRRFTRTAELAELAGFDGVEIHAAHGYLLSQFLSPLANKRLDRWGGSLENRARLLIEVIRSVRRVVSRGFTVAVKLNSADFQRGGFSPDDACHVVCLLNEMAVDVVELSGGSYEAPAMQGEARDGRTLSREAYFLEFARDISAVARMPLMLTGGIRRRAVAEEVITSGVSLVGMATSMAYDPNLPREWRAGNDRVPVLRQLSWKNKTLRAVANMAVVKYQLRRLSEGRPPRPDVSAVRAFVLQQMLTACQTRQYRRWMQHRNTSRVTL